MEIKSDISGNHKNTLMMILGCLIPLVILGILWVIGVSQSILSFGILLLCPILHFVMMKNMKRENVENENVKHGIQNIEGNNGSKMNSENKREELA
jgi:hypothetical protein